MADDTRVSEQEKAQLSKRRGQAAAQIVDPAERQKFISAQGDSESKNKGELPVADNKRLSEGAALMGFKKGTPYVPKTGKAIVHKGEAVIPAEKNNPMGLAEAALAHPDMPEITPKKPAKQVKSVHVRKAHPGYIAENHHTEPQHHPMSEHALANMEELKKHLDSSIGPDESEKVDNPSEEGQE
jgi:hypothetical protein